eukprot:TRINITY_DN42269_c0_g1_i1.p1 TRINITY_DN42269_c0_g1~~TRINITY_DN42269_c0_g1_i1.p1  ORF type:complete len:508 (-),score=138.40 TRINITY_DN42269_c0_g1_i1:8-1483(-)
MVYESVLHHGIDILHTPAVQQAFIKVGPALEKLSEAGHNLAHWAQDHLPVLSSTASVAAEPKFRFVEYFAKDCPHCQHLEPVWKTAATQWAEKHPDSEVVWEQKECFGPGWMQGKDFQDCEKQAIDGFPTVKLFSKGDDKGVFFEDNRTADGLVKFVEANTTDAAKELSSAKEAAVAAVGNEHWGGGKVVEYFAASCPHCKAVEPVWKQAQQAWAAEHPGDSDVRWEQKECWADGWKPGKDREECLQEGVHSFPTIRFISKGGLEARDFDESRSVDKLLAFVKEHATKPEEEHNAGEAAPAPEPATQAAASAADAETAVGPVKVVEFVAKSCPHCQHLEPVWKDAQAQWSAGHEGSNVAWEQKECFAEGWKPGKDMEECNRSHVGGFPTIKLYHGESAAPEGGDTFHGPRTAAGLLKWVDEHSGSPANLEAAPKPEPSVAKLEKSLDTLKQGAVQASLGALPLVTAALCGPSAKRQILRQEVRRQQQAHFL